MDCSANLFERVYPPEYIENGKRVKRCFSVSTFNPLFTVYISLNILFSTNLAVADAYFPLFPNFLKSRALYHLFRLFQKAMYYRRTYLLITVL